MTGKAAKARNHRAARQRKIERMRRALAMAERGVMAPLERQEWKAPVFSNFNATPVFRPHAHTRAHDHARGRARGISPATDIADPHPRIPSAQGGDDPTPTERTDQ